MPQCGVMGQAAGNAAVLSMEEDVPPRDIDVKKLQEMLRAQGCVVEAKDIERAKG